MNMKKPLAITILTPYDQLNLIEFMEKRFPICNLISRIYIVDIRIGQVWFINSFGRLDSSVSENAFKSMHPGIEPLQGVPKDEEAESVKSFMTPLTKVEKLDFIERLKALCYEKYYNKILLQDYVYYSFGSGECGGDKFDDDIQAFEKIISQDKDPRNKDAGDIKSYQQLEEDNHKLRHGFEKGYLCAVAQIINTHGEDTIAADVLKGCSMSIVEMRRIGIDENDLKVLKPLVEYLESKK
jgi:hypothetical protein